MGTELSLLGDRGPHPNKATWNEWPPKSAAALPDTLSHEDREEQRLRETCKLPKFISVVAARFIPSHVFPIEVTCFSLIQMGQHS